MNDGNEGNAKKQMSLAERLARIKNAGPEELARILERESQAKEARLLAEREAAKRAEECLADGLRFCEAYKIKIVEPKQKWDDSSYPADLEQIEALRRFGVIEEFESCSWGHNKWFATNILNRCIRKAREASQVWLSVEELRQRELEREVSKAALGEFRRRYADLRIEALCVLGDKCEMCEENDPRALEIDHRHDDGAQHRATASPIEILEDVVVEGRAFYQLLCGTHHNKKTAEARERAKAAKDVP